MPSQKNKLKPYSDYPVMAIEEYIIVAHLPLASVNKVFVGIVYMVILSKLTWVINHVSACASKVMATLNSG